MNREEKQEQIERLREVFQGNPTGFLTGFSGLKVEQLNNLRNLLRKEGIGYQVVKNSLAKKALKGTELEGGLEKMLEGPTALAYTAEEPAKPAKILKAFSKDNDKLIVKGGYMYGSVFGQKDLDRVAALPGKNELRSAVLSAIIGVPRGLVTVFNEVPASFVRLINARREALEKGEAPAVAAEG